MQCNASHRCRCLFAFAFALVSLLLLLPLLYTINTLRITFVAVPVVVSILFATARNNITEYVRKEQTHARTHARNRTLNIMSHWLFSLNKLTLPFYLQWFQNTRLSFHAIFDMTIFSFWLNFQQSSKPTQQYASRILNNKSQCFLKYFYYSWFSHFIDWKTFGPFCVSKK